MHNNNLVNGLLRLKSCICLLSHMVKVLCCGMLMQVIKIYSEAFLINYQENVSRIVARPHKNLNEYLKWKFSNFYTFFKTHDTILLHKLCVQHQNCLF